ncbi:MAG TPA: type II secretion system F family protein [Xanthobacteraceae bacterium]|nr:type II secretion system F family protein [Xanthobacteraceae bacterium]
MTMPLEIDETVIFCLLAAGSVVLLVEAIYLLCFSTASYRNNINRRLRLMKKQPNQESILIQLRRERGLTSAGGFRLPIATLNRLVMQSGLSIGFARLLIVVAIFGIGVFIAVFWFRESAAEALLAALASAIVVPFAGLSLLRRRRRARFGQQFPDAIDIIVRSLRAGHPVPVAVSMVAREMTDPVGTEFGIVADEITYGADMETAMRNLSSRVGQEDLPLFVTAIAIQGTTGGNLSEILANLSAVIRMRYKMRRKIRALAAEGKFSAFFLSGLPVAVFLLLNVATPDFYSSVWDKSVTKIGLGCAVGWMALGNLMMYRMVNFKI